jgi:hypothetical protein
MPPYATRNEKNTDYTDHRIRIIRVLTSIVGCFPITAMIMLLLLVDNVKKDMILYELSFLDGLGRGCLRGACGNESQSGVFP